MKTHILLCGLFVILCASPGIAQDRASIAKETYDKVIADQPAQKVKELEKAAVEAESWKKFESDQAKNRAEYEAAEYARRKECGADYGQIRIGMELVRVQQCVAEFFLRGQLNIPSGIVDYYTRGDSWLYIQKGRVMAWGE